MAGKSQKFLVRNPAVPINRQQASQKHSQEVFDVTCSEATDESQNLPGNDLRVPEFCTTLQIAKEIKDVQKMCPGPTPSELFQYQRLNFLPTDKIYHGLINLDVSPDINVKGRTTVIHSKKDPEPNFKELLKYDLQPEYYFSSCVAPDVQKKAPQFDGHSLYDKNQIWVRNANY